MNDELRKVRWHVHTYTSVILIKIFVYLNEAAISSDKNEAINNMNLRDMQSSNYKHDRLAARSTNFKSMISALRQQNRWLACNDF